VLGLARVGQVALLVAAALLAEIVLGPRAHPGREAITTPSTARSAAPAAARPPPVPPSAPWLAGPARHLRAHLAPHSDPGVLPGDVLIADKLNNRLIVVDPQGRIRWQFPRPGDLRPGQSFRKPDDAFFSPDGTKIIATQEDVAVISVIDVAAHRIVYRYGLTGHPGSGVNRLDNPDDAMLLPDGRILTADIKNCRILIIAPGAHRPARVIGRTTQACRHHPPRRWGSPNGVFPMRGSQYIVTEINGDWVDAIDLRGTVAWSTHPPGVAYPSDTSQIGADRYLTVDYSDPGQVVVFNRAGRTLWRYRPTTSQALNHPSLALALPNGDIALNDDFNHRVIVIDPQTRRVVWQYGHTGRAGRRPGYLDNPDGIDLVPPSSLLIRSRGGAAGH
jgi:DNA-binding beta-propeller fold protein YncE